VIPAARRVARAVLGAGLASGIVLLIGRLVDGGSPGWPVAVGLFGLLVGAELIGPGAHRPAAPRRGTTGDAVGR
jgi:hypothetical protein